MRFCAGGEPDHAGHEHGTMACHADDGRREDEGSPALRAFEIPPSRVGMTTEDIASA